MENLQLLYPEIVLSVLALLILLADVWLGGRRGRSLYGLAMVCAAVTMGFVGLCCSVPGTYQGVGTLWTVDPMSLFFKVLVLATAILVLALTLDYKNPRDAHQGSFSALVLFSVVGMMLLVSATDFLLIFLALELVSISSFILVGFERGDLKSSEGAVKYFLIGAFSSAIMLYGISLFYGATGTTSLLALRAPAGPDAAMFTLGCLMTLAGFGFKVSMAPFHFWVPDAYEGAPTPVTTFLSIAPKISALAVMLRVFTSLIPREAFEFTGLFTVLAILTMCIGNLTALFQTNVKRLLAYSSIAQAGYMLIGFVTGDAFGREGILLYSLAYLVMNLGAFTVAILVGNEGSYELEAFDGLASRNFGLALLMTFCLLSLAGIPPLAGFIGKFYLFAAAVKGGFYTLAIFGLLNSVVSVYYYTKIAYHMFFRPARTPEPVAVPVLYSGLTLTLVSIFIFLIGVYPEPFLGMAKLSAEMLPKAAPAALLGGGR
ncbi:MAG TPA: NADH-quinone oxidoreductase subunit N [Elusimicrobiota bacterium]|jgi:proton-translocating NADH-quinone oxidoreductase chain N|nr:NADH-quinone oxidoreductase subunit N [Elusimicrobiota bacterium]